MCDHSYPKKLAFQYLEDLKNEFERVNGNQIETAARPYAFIKFGPYLQVCPCCHCDWDSTDALLGQEQDMVTESNSQASCYGAGTWVLRAPRIDSGSTDASMAYPASAHSSE